MFVDLQRLSKKLRHRDRHVKAKDSTRKRPSLDKAFSMECGSELVCGSKIR
jgi:hypothetical protein